MTDFALDIAGAMLASRVALAQVYASRFMREADPMAASHTVREEMKSQLRQQLDSSSEEDAETDRKLFESAAGHLDLLFEQVDIVLAAAELRQSGRRPV